MSRSRRHRRRTRSSSVNSSRPLVAFLLVASFGILFAGCSGPSQPEAVQEESFTFTEQDLERFKELANDAMADEESGVLSDTPLLVGSESADLPDESPVLDLSMASMYQSIRTGPAATGENVYRVTNDFLNVRTEARATAEAIERLVRGDVVEVVDFVNAAWAQVRLPDGREGYVAQRYIAMLTSEEQLSAQREKFKGRYFVDFGFLNVRKTTDTNSEKIGELPGQTFVNVLSQDDVWARITFGEGEGYVAVQYLSEFQPNFLVRQDEFTFPILHYRLDTPGVLESMPTHLDAVRNAGFSFMTMGDIRNLLLAQQERDVRLEPRSVGLIVSGVTSENVKDVDDVLRASGLNATLFVETRHIGINGITEKTILTLLANGNEIQSAGHTGDDLRSLTNAQVDLELAQSRQIIEQYTGKPVYAIAYPVGGVNDRIAHKAAEAGYLLGVGTSQERTFTRGQLLRMPSFVVSASSTAEEVLGLIGGSEGE